MNSEENEIRKRAYTFDLESVCKTLRICSSSSISKEKVMSFLESNGTTSFMTLATIYALYSTDVMYLCFDKNADIVFEIISTLAFTLFFVEIIVQSWCRENYLRIPTKQGIVEAWHNASLTSRYRDKVKLIFAACQFGSFYFWLDMMSTVSMIFEIPWLLPSFLSSEVNNSNIDSARAGKASRAGAKAARMIKVVRMIRLVRLVKLYKYFAPRKKGAIAPEEELADEMGPESRLGAEMSDRTTKRVIVGILFMLIFIPLLQADEVEYLNQLSLQIIFDRRLYMIANGVTSASIAAWSFTEQYFLLNSKCIHLEYSGFHDAQHLLADIPEDRADRQDLRNIETSVIRVVNSDDTYSLSAHFDESARVDAAALLNIILTTFVIFLLAAGTLTFAKDVNHLVIIPIEKMVHLVNEISVNPLGNHITSSNQHSKNSDDGMETTLLLQTISKIAGLMRVGFGEAGAEIISRNLDLSGDGTSMNLFGKGQKLYSIFAFCDVRNFTDTTECLQEEVMLFVNRIAYILHGIVVQYEGSANKNIGDAFLLTWKVNINDVGSCKPLVKYVADKALLSIVKTLIFLRRHEDFICDFSSRALSALYLRLPRYKCNIGCGLHFGWAVEGAIGSEKKIDATYISPHVNWTEFLEGSTKEFGVPLLMSGHFHDLLSLQAKKYCRQVDNIKKHGDITGLFTFDINLENLDLINKRQHQCNIQEESFADDKINARRASNLPYFQKATPAKRSFNQRKTVIKPKRTSQVKIHTSLGDAPDVTMPKFHLTIWEDDPDIKASTMHISQHLREEWKKGIDAFTSGQWDAAATSFRYFSENHNPPKCDGPARHLLAQMQRFDFTPPPNWKGYRSITS